MTPPGMATPNFSDTQLVELVELIGGADSVELKLTIPESEQRSAVAALGMDPLDAQIRQVYFFDTPDLTLYEHGLVVRARRTQGRDDDSVVKLRPVVPNELPKTLSKSKAFGIEVDAMPGGYVCSGSMKEKLEPGDVKRAIAGECSLRELYSNAQRSLFLKHRPEDVELDDLSVLGPIFVLKLKFSPEGYGHKLVAELWWYPDYSRVLELSTKSAPSEAFQVAAETRAFLSERGVDLSGEQETKTRKALEFFSTRLQSADSKETS
jgi:hypothetical protein